MLVINIVTGFASAHVLADIALGRLSRMRWVGQAYWVQYSLTSSWWYHSYSIS